MEQRSSRWNPVPRKKFKSRNKDIAGDLTFDNTGPNDAANFQHALRGIADYLHRTYSTDVADAICNMKVVVIDIPYPPEIKQDKAGNDIPISSIEEYKWKEEYKEQIAWKRLYNTSTPKAFIHIYNQCSTNLKNGLGTSSAYPSVDTAKDPIGLLKLIQGLCCSNDLKTQSVMETIASHKLFFTYYQKDGINKNTTSHRKFMAHVKTIETYRGIGAIGIIPTFITQKLKAMYDDGTCADFDKPTEIELAATKKSVVCEEFLPV